MFSTQHPCLENFDGTVLIRKRDESLEEIKMVKNANGVKMTLDEYWYRIY